VKETFSVKHSWELYSAAERPFRYIGVMRPALD
jgi:hypothetical protein